MQNPIEKLTEFVQQSPSAICIRQPIKGEWKEYSYQDFYNRAVKMASALNKAGMAGQNVAILSKNCAHWIISDFAIWMSGGVSVPLLSTYSNETLEKILSLSGVKTVFCGKLDNWKKIKEVIPAGVQCVSFPDFPLEGCTTWEDYCLQNQQENFSPIARGPKELATITYTSGSTGTPKGVMHDFAALSFVGQEIPPLLDFKRGDQVLSYLPIAHVAERALNEFGALYGGATISFVEGLETFAKTCQELQPSVFLAVPRIWQKLQEGILKKIPQKKLNLLLSIPIVSGLIKKKIKENLGISKAKYTISGAAALPPALFDWFKKLDILIRDGYGMTETFAFAHFALQKKVKPRSVGQALNGVTSRISEEGELQIKSPSNMMGFYNDEAMTKEAFTEDGYLRTGDMGKIDSEGFLFITGRLKELFKTSKGKYIVPNQIESKLSRLEIIDLSCVVGDCLEQPYALLSLSPSCRKKNIDEIKEELLNFLSEVNKELESHEKIAKMIVTSEEWTVDKNFITPTMKIKRNVIEEYFKNDVIESSKNRDKIHFLNK